MQDSSTCIQSPSINTEIASERTVTQELKSVRKCRRTTLGLADDSSGSEWWMINFDDKQSNAGSFREEGGSSLETRMENNKAPLLPLEPG